MQEIKEVNKLTLRNYDTGEVLLEIDNPTVECVTHSKIIEDILKKESYECSVCRKTVRPIIHLENNTLNLEIDRYQVRGGRGNRVVQSDICQECGEKALEIFKFLK